MSIELRAPTPIFVGISSRRRLLEEDDDLPPDLAIDAFFDALVARFPRSDIILVTSLDSASGRIGAARAAARGVRYVAVLPEPPAAYRARLAGSGGHAARALLTKAAAVLELPAPESAFEGSFTQHCAILMTHAEGPARDERPFAIESGYATLEPIVDEIADARPSTATTGEAAAWSTVDTIERWNARGAGRYRLDASLCGDAFDAADRFAVGHQRNLFRAVDWVYWMTLGSTISLQTYDHLGAYVPGAAGAAQLFGVAFFGCIIAAITIVARIHTSDVQSRFQDYRALAEGLRVQSALLREGIDVDAALRYRDDGSPDIVWIRRAVDAAYVAAKIDTAATLPPGSGADWIAGQRAYYERAAARNGEHASRANRIAVRWLRLSVATAVLIAIDGIAHFANHAPPGKKSTSSVR